MEQFTFYDIYYDVITQLADDEAGRFIKRICNFTVMDKPDIPSRNERENCFWEIIFPILSEVTETERQGKTPYYPNRKMKHFVFKAPYARMLFTMKEDADAGIFIKALCAYMFESKEPTEIPPHISNYFKLFKKSLDISKVRSESGRKGGKKSKNS